VHHFEISGATNASVIADYLIWFGQRHGDPLTNLKLQKLLYYAQGMYLAKNHRPLFRDPLQAWIRGPVVYKIWQKYNSYKWQPITKSVEQPKVSHFVLGAVQDVVDNYWHCSAFLLEQMTHSESPWINARGGAPADTPSSSEISLGDMYEFFSAELYASKRDVMGELDQQEPTERGKLADAIWRAILANDDLKRARSKLSIHEIRLIVRHALDCALPEEKT